MKILSIVITAFVVIGILDIMTQRSQKKTQSLKKFLVRAPIDFAIVGAAGAICVIGIFIFDLIHSDDMPFFLVILLIVIILLPSGLLMIAPIKGVWDIIVDNDDITVVKAFIFKRHWKFSKITYGKLTRGGLKVYVEGRRRKAFFVDGMCEGYSNFIKRMEKEEKEIRYPKEKEK